MGERTGMSVLTACLMVPLQPLELYKDAGGGGGVLESCEDRYIYFLLYKVCVDIGMVKLHLT